jgi:hypothetical protein
MVTLCRRLSVLIYSEYLIGSQLAVEVEIVREGQPHLPRVRKRKAAVETAAAGSALQNDMNTAGMQTEVSLTGTLFSHFYQPHCVLVAHDIRPTAHTACVPSVSESVRVLERTDASYARAHQRAAVRMRCVPPDVYAKCPCDQTQTGRARAYLSMP